MTSPIDHKKLAISRLAVQFRESNNLKNYIEALLNEASDLETVFQQILNERSIDTAVGAQLDVIGEIVGQSRIIQNGVFVKYFGFKNNPNATGFNINRFWNGSSPTLSAGTLDDDTYRLYIRAKISTNHSSATHENFVTIFKILFGNDTKTLTEDIGNAKTNITIGHIFTPEEEQLIINSKQTSILPLAAGIGYSFFKTAGNGSMGFAGNPFATGFNRGGFLSKIGE